MSVFNWIYVFFFFFQKDMGSASVEVLRIFTEIENLEQKIRRSADKDAENLKLITTIEVCWFFFNWAKTDLDLFRQRLVARMIIACT